MDVDDLQEFEEDESEQDESEQDEDEEEGEEEPYMSESVPSDDPLATLAIVAASADKPSEVRCSMPVSTLVTARDTMRTACTPHANCTPHAHCVHTACSPHAHRMLTACTPHAQRMHNACTHTPHARTHRMVAAMKASLAEARQVASPLPSHLTPPHRPSPPPPLSRHTKCGPLVIPGAKSHLRFPPRL